MKPNFSFLLVFAFLVISAQEIKDKETFKKCRKEFNKKSCLAEDDGDGVLNYLDVCKDVAGPPENNGCPFPNTDGDDVLDKDDVCPFVAGPPENNGCPWQDTDGDGIIDIDDKCPTVVGVIEKEGCPQVTHQPHMYSKEELEQVKKEFLESTKDIDYNKLADIFFSKIDKEKINSKIIYLKIASFHQMAGCGFDRTDYSPLNLRVNLASEKFWNERNFKKFTQLFPDKIILPYSEDEKINKKIQSYKNIYSKKRNSLTFYNSKNNFKNIDIKENYFYYKVSIDIHFLNNYQLVVFNSENYDSPIRYMEIKIENGTYTQINK